MNIHQSEILDFLKSIGVTVTLVADDQASEFDKDALLGAVDESRISLHRPRIESELKDKYISDAKGVAGGTLKAQLARNFGMSVSDFKDLKDEEAILKAVSHFKSLQDGEKEDVNNRIAEIISKNKEANDAYKLEMEGKLSDAVKKYQDRDIKDFIQSKLKEVAIKPDADISKVANLIMSTLSDELDFKYDEQNRSAVPYYKGSDLKALNVAKNSDFDWKERIEGALKPFSLIETDLKGRSAAAAMSQRQQQQYQNTTTKPTQTGGTASQKVSSFMEQVNGAIAQSAPIA